MPATLLSPNPVLYVTVIDFKKNLNTASQGWIQSSSLWIWVRKRSSVFLGGNTCLIGTCPAFRGSYMAGGHDDWDKCQGWSRKPGREAGKFKIWRK